MSYIEDYGLDTPARKWVVLTLAVEPMQGKIDIMHLQKIVRYFEYLRDTKELDYSDFKYGAVSYELQENLDELIASGLVEEADGKYTLTAEGEQIAKTMLKDFDIKECQKLVFAKQQLSDLPSDELMYFMYKLIPSTQKNSTEFPRLEKKKSVLIRCLFLKGRINANTAARWLDMSEKDFLDFVRDCS